MTSTNTSQSTLNQMEGKTSSPAPKYARYTITTSEWHYLKIKINFDPPTDPLPTITSLALRSLISRSLSEAFGVIGSGIHVDILYWSGDDHQSEEYIGVIRVPREDLTTLWSSLTLFTATLDVGNQMSKEINFEVLGNSAFLMGLCTDSRVWTKKLLNP
ncbi:14793_t:CDS:2 [Gigaspora margarita]|uniref:Ribonuclease p protein subunit rpp14 n=2 Tax=Gigaspora margarita TaxID=4874 RepID=A0A8H4EI77_GIGMA|nr:ribonuclease p protein subunit rpp14 [Gigaspora margarita]CAG8599645.1 14793_t:CDS:2 [Gigaspora margarita]